MAEVKLLGTWPSPYYYRVVWALKLKGIAYEFIEEDLANKSPLLLHYNPVYKKIPVLVHGGKPICESMIIIDYIEETWPQPSLLPIDPYERAMARFWTKFADDKSSLIWMVYWSKGEEQEKAVKESLEMLKTIEEHALGVLGDEENNNKKKKLFGGDEIGMVDIAFGQLVQWLPVIEDVTGLKLLEAGEFPRLQAWIRDFKQVPIIKQNLPDHDHMFAFFKALREN